jgi:ribosome-associated protein
LSDLPKEKNHEMAARIFGNSPDSLGFNAEQLSAETQLPFLDDDARTPVDEAAKALALAIAEAADDRKAGNITILQTGDISYLADYFVIITGFSNVQVRAIANSIEGTIQTQFERLPLRTEGAREGRWVLQDYGDVIVHIFLPDDREYYDLEAFWGHAERIEFVPAPASVSASSVKYS